MKVNKTKKIVVTEYVSDFGDVFEDEKACLKSEVEKYNSMLNKALKSEFAPIVSKLLKEIDTHSDNAYCELGICDKVLCNIL